MGWSGNGAPLAAIRVQVGVAWVVDRLSVISPIFYGNRGESIDAQAAPFPWLIADGGPPNLG